MPETRGRKANELVDLAKTNYRFRMSTDGRPFAVRRGTRIAIPLGSGRTGLGTELAALFFQEPRQVVGTQVIATSQGLR